MRDHRCMLTRKNRQCNVVYTEDLNVFQTPTKVSPQDALAQVNRGYLWHNSTDESHPIQSHYSSFISQSSKRDRHPVRMKVVTSC